MFMNGMTLISLDIFNTCLLNWLSKIVYNRSIVTVIFRQNLWRNHSQLRAVSQYNIVFHQCASNANYPTKQKNLNDWEKRRDSLHSSIFGNGMGHHFYGNRIQLRTVRRPIPSYAKRMRKVLLTKTFCFPTDRRYC